MSMIFRKSVLGFNKDDVLNYINELFDKINRMEQDHEKVSCEQKERIVDLSSHLNESYAKNNQLAEENEKLRAEIAAFDAERKKLTDVSEVIGKLFLVSKLNADSLIRSAKDMKNRTDEEIRKNMELLERTQETLSELKSRVAVTSDEYSKSLDEVVSSLADAKTAMETTRHAQHNTEKNLDALRAAAEASIK